MEIVLYRRQRVDYGEQSDTTCLVPKFACCVAGPSEFFIQWFSIERSRTASQFAVLQRAKVTPSNWGDLTRDVWRSQCIKTLRIQFNSIQKHFIAIQNIYITVISSETCLWWPPNGTLFCLLQLILVARGHLDELQKAEIVSKSKLVPSVFIKHITE